MAESTGNRFVLFCGGRIASRHQKLGIIATSNPIAICTATHKHKYIIYSRPDPQRNIQNNDISAGWKVAKCFVFLFPFYHQKRTVIYGRQGVHVKRKNRRVQTKKKHFQFVRLSACKTGTFPFIYSVQQCFYFLIRGVWFNSFVVWRRHRLRDRRHMQLLHKHSGGIKMLLLEVFIVVSRAWEMSFRGIFRN